MAVRPQVECIFAMSRTRAASTLFPDLSFTFAIFHSSHQLFTNCFSFYLPVPRRDGSQSQLSLSAPGIEPGPILHMYMSEHVPEPVADLGGGGGEGGEGANGAEMLKLCIIY